MLGGPCAQTPRLYRRERAADAHALGRSRNGGDNGIHVVVDAQGTLLLKLGGEVQKQWGRR